MLVTDKGELIKKLMAGDGTIICIVLSVVPNLYYWIVWLVNTGFRVLFIYGQWNYVLYVLRVGAIRPMCGMLVILCVVSVCLFLLSLLTLCRELTLVQRLANVYIVYKPQILRRWRGAIKVYETYSFADLCVIEKCGLKKLTVRTTWKFHVQTKYYGMMPWYAIMTLWDIWNT